MRTIFMGSAAFACPSLDRLISKRDIELAAVVTQPDRPRGRNLEIAACPVKSRVESLGIPVLTPVDINAPGSVAALRDCGPDLIVVVAYGQILKPAILSMPPLGCINLHASLLPKYRGAAPIQWAIANGERATGVTTQFMNERMDAGDILLQRTAAISPDDTAGSLHDKLASLGAGTLDETVAQIRSGTVERIPQEEADATFAPKLSKSDGRIDWHFPAAVLANRIRAFNPWPACHAEIPEGSGRMVKVLIARVERGSGVPGTVLAVTGDGPLIQTGDGAVRLLQVQPEGKKPMTGSDFIRGCRIAVGDRLG